MKLKFLLLFLALFMQFSCNKWMELLPPEGLTKDEFWKTKEDVQAVLMGTYNALASMDDLFFKYGEMRGDLVKGDYNLAGDEQKIMAGNIYPDNSMNNWSKFYQVINYCNEIIVNAPIVQGKDKTFTDYQLKSDLSEAYYIRSLCYFYLVRIYKDVPLVLEPTKNDATNVYPFKSDADTVLTQIVKDLKVYRTYASNSFPTIMETKGRVTRAAYDALLADISLWNFDYNSCISYCENIEGANLFSLGDPQNWYDNYFPGNSLESIFELQYSNSLGQKNHTYDLTQTLIAPTYRPSDKVSLIMFAQVDATSESFRAIGSIQKNNATSYTIWKYIGMRADGVSVRPAIIQNSCGWIVYRLADVLLMKAEALSQLGRYSEAQTPLWKVRKRAGVSQDLLPNTPDKSEDVILDERARELAFEGKRWFDLLRLGRRNNFSRKLDLVDIILSNVPATQKRILKVKLANPLGWYLPIAKDELERNKNLVQNPYYYVSQ